MSDTFTTADRRSWAMEDLEAVPEPDLKDPESVERFLRVAAQIIPRLQIEHHNVTCSCDCSACYRVDMWEKNRNTNEIRGFRTSHFRNNETCGCERDACPCRS